MGTRCHLTDDINLSLSSPLLSSLKGPRRFRPAGRELRHLGTKGQAGQAGGATLPPRRPQAPSQSGHRPAASETLDVVDLSVLSRGFVTNSRVGTPYRHALPKREAAGTQPPPPLEEKGTKGSPRLPSRRDQPPMKPDPLTEKQTRIFFVQRKKRACQPSPFLIKRTNCSSWSLGVSKGARPLCAGLVQHQPTGRVDAHCPSSNDTCVLCTFACEVCARSGRTKSARHAVSKNLSSFSEISSRLFLYALQFYQIFRLPSLRGRRISLV